MLLAHHRAMAIDRERRITYFGKTTWRNEGKKFGIRLADRRSHMYIIGKTGTGKSTLLKTMILQDMDHGHGLALLDPHGDLSADIRKAVPEHRKNDLIDFDVPDKWQDLSVQSTYLEYLPENQRALATSNILSVFQKDVGCILGAAAWNTYSGTLC